MTTPAKRTNKQEAKCKITENRTVTLEIPQKRFVELLASMFPQLIGYELSKETFVPNDYGDDKVVDVEVENEGTANAKVVLKMALEKGETIGAAKAVTNNQDVFKVNT